MNHDKACIRLNQAFQYVDDRFLDIVEQEMRMGQRKRGKRLLSSLGAAALLFSLLLTLPAVVMAYNWFGLRDLILPKSGEAGLTPFYEYLNRPETRAATEWKSFLAEYGEEGDPGWETENFSVEDRSGWALYGVDSPEMGKALDEIAGRYRLTLHTSRKVLSPGELEKMAGDCFVGEVPVKNGILYEDGSFRFEGHMELNAFDQTFFLFRCAVNGSFDKETPFCWRQEGDEEQQYTSDWGKTVLLVLGDSRALIYAELDKCLVTVDITCGRDSGLRPEDLQELADRINLTFLETEYASKLDGAFVPSPGDSVALSGYPESPEALALAEWQTFLAGYDMDKALNEIGNGSFAAEGREDWSLYGVYSYEMGEKLDEITARHNLRLHTELEVVEPGELEYRAGGSFLAEGCTIGYGYIYENGAFSVDGEAELGGCGLTDLQIRRSVKGTFEEAVLNIDNAEDYTQAPYTAVCGERVLLCLGHLKAVIFADFDDCFIMVNVLAGRNEGMTAEDLQNLADRIDFRVLKEVHMSKYMQGFE